MWTVNVLEMYRVLGPDLNCVEDTLRRRLSCSETVLQEAASQLVEAGGKRLRPVFVLLAGAFGKRRDQLVTVATGLELIHMATLVHDDVIDDSDTRRGSPTVRRRFGNRMAMYAGDYIFAQALSTLAEVDNSELHLAFSKALELLCLGEMEQIRDLFSLDQPMRTYLRRIRRKTAFLIEMSCLLGALAAEASVKQVAALRRFGYFSGMAFQIKDDILDFIADERVLGKPVGGDLRQGNITAPLLFALRDPACAAELRGLIHPGITAGDADRAIRLVRDSEGIARAQELADRYLARARRALFELPGIPAREGLLAVAEFVGARDK